MNYVPLYVKTEYSLLESLIHIPDLVKEASKMGYKAISICDANMYGVMEFYLEAKRNNIKPVIGMEATFEDKKIVLYAKNYNGYKSLINLETIMSSRSLTLEDFYKYDNDVICILPFLSRDLKDTFNKIYDDLYIGYTSKEEFELIDSNIALYFNPVLSLKREDTVFLPYLEAINKGILKEKVLTDYRPFYLKTKEEYEEVDYTISNNQKLLNKINIEIPKREDLLPVYDTGDIIASKYLRKLCKEGLKNRFGDVVAKVYIDRLNYELEVIDSMGFSNYFLVVWDYVKFAKENGILVGPGRGSAAGSLVSYVLNITDIDPIKYNLLFERFLNPERTTMPDIDVDFLDSRRDEVINYCVSKYGKNKTAGIIAFGTLAAKQAVRDVCRTLDIESDDISKLLNSKLSLKENLENKKLQDFLNRNKEYKEAYKIALKLEGLKRHTSIHAAGIVISREDLFDVLPLINHDNMYLTAYGKDYLEDLGLLKMDFLALKNLNIINHVITSLKEDGISIDLSKIPLNDKKTLEIFETVNTIGIFQFESEGMMNFLRKLKPNSFDDIVSSLGLYRPGPMGNIDTFIKRRKGEEKVDYLDPRLEPILKPTFGILIYQEQIMQVANVMASYTLGEADIFMRAMKKKKEDVILKEKERFINNSIKNGYSEKTATYMYELILKFASYGFNKAHSVSYAMISYQMAYLKAHYPAYFMRGLLDLSIGSVASTKSYLYEVIKNKIEIKRPDINLSGKTYLVEDGKIRYPLYNIKNVGTSAVDTILEERSKEPFKDIYDFIARTYSKAVNKGTLTNLILAGAFDSFGMNKKTLITNLDEILNYGEVISYLDKDYALKPVIEETEEYSKSELMNFEAQLFGFYLENHPVTEARLKYGKKLALKDISNYFNQKVEVIAVVSSHKEIKTKKNEIMGFIALEDETMIVDAVLFPKVYQGVHIKVGDLVVVKGNVEKRFDKYQLIVDNINTLEE